MSPAVSLSLAAVVAYLIGSVPFGLLIARLRGIDVRRHGSGNIGATNVGRVLGKKWGVLCLMLDALKGLLATLLLPHLVPLPADWLSAAAVACGAAAIAGHVFPIWLGFRGGKGVATGAGVAAVVCWPAALAATATFAITFAVSRFVSLPSIVASILYAVATFAVLGATVRDEWPTALFAVAIPALIVARHRGNIRRLLRGEEAGFSASTPSEPVRPT